MPIVSIEIYVGLLIVVAYILYRLKKGEKIKNV